MPIDKSPYWTELYYRIVEHYFWRPQDIGRKSDPAKPGHPWGYWQKKLEAQETPLNHILDLLFHMAPQSILDQITTRLLGRAISGLELVHATPDLVDPNIVQPDIILLNEFELIFIEMKVDSRSSLDQYAKYAIAALSIRSELPNIETTDLVILGRHASHPQVWRGARKLGLDSTEKVKYVVAAGLREQSDIWKERGVQKYLSAFPEKREALANQAETMGLHLADYTKVADVLKGYSSPNDSLGPFVDGVLYEFRKRQLIESP